MNLPVSLRLAATLMLSTVACLNLYGCGGGGSSTPVSAPVPTPTAPPVVVPVTPAPLAPPPAPTIQLSLASSTVTPNQTTVLSWSSSNAASCTASGSWTGAQNLGGSFVVSQSTAGVYSYTLTCSASDTSITTSSTATLTVASKPVSSNVLAVTVDSGPTGDAFNVPFVDVTVCNPGGTLCKTIDHVMVDTGSYGLRLFASDTASLVLPDVVDTGSNPIAECVQFVSGYMWGPVRRADIKLAGELAANIPVEIVGDSSSLYATPPTACTSKGAAIQTAAQLGAKGILGVGLFNQDCPACSTSTAPNLYYSCTPTGCKSVVVPLSSQVANPVVKFAVNNNGVVLSLPVVGDTGASSLTGTLTFGIGTQSNNQPGAIAVFPTNGYGNFTTQYKGVSYTASFIDSGSNGLFFEDTALTKCSSFYCPSEGTVALSATHLSPVSGASGSVNFTVSNINAAQWSTTAYNAGGTLGLANSFDWGLPFFFGRSVYVAIQGRATPKGAGPYWAY